MRPTGLTTVAESVNSLSALTVPIWRKTILCVLGQ